VVSPRRNINVSALRPGPNAIAQPMERAPCFVVVLGLEDQNRIEGEKLESPRIGADERGGASVAELEKSEQLFQRFTFLEMQLAQFQTHDQNARARFGSPL
jgi:hypothetical protein